MVTKPQRPEGRDSALSILNAAIDTLNLAKEISSITPAKALFGSVSILLTMIKACFSLVRGGRPLIHVYLGLHGQ